MHYCKAETAIPLPLRSLVSKYLHNLITVKEQVNSLKPRDNIVNESTHFLSLKYKAIVPDNLVYLCKCSSRVGQHSHLEEKVTMTFKISYIKQSFHEYFSMSAESILGLFQTLDIQRLKDGVS